MGNKNLHNAKISKNDEFYTQYTDIQKEIDAYLEYNPNVFRDKTILLPCDDPEWSNFTKFFVQNFEKFGLKKLISTCYIKNNCQTDLFENDCLQNFNSHGKILTITKGNLNSKWQYLKGDGDFRSDEIKALRDESDFIITNPPFSLFREFVSWIFETDKKFLIIGNMNAITCKEVFPLFKDNKMWYGVSISSGDRRFNVPDSYPLNASGCGIDDNNQKYIQVKGVRWFTNIDHGKRHKPLSLLTMNDNLRFNKKLQNPKYQYAYKKYDNYDAIEIPLTEAIPSDYEGIMGVPISFLDKYCPEQFELVGISADLANPIVLPNGKKGSGRFYMNGKRLYDRIAIKYTKQWIDSHPSEFAPSYHSINNRRYTGSKFKLMPWIKDIIRENCLSCSTLFDVFGGTGVVTASLLDSMKSVIINDFLFSNEVIYHAFFGNETYDITKLLKYCESFNSIDRAILSSNYVSDNYGGKYFSSEDAKLIGYIRQNIDDEHAQGRISDKEYYILLASLLYSFDKCANTVGHYEAYIKRNKIRSNFVFKLIKPISSECEIRIFRADANKLAPRIQADLAFLDPPYNSRQYSRFYHVMETITKWDKPALSGVAMKPPEENMSDYCRSTAAKTFEHLVSSLNVKYILVTYNNTYDSKSGSSQNKITLEQIKYILEKRGLTKVYEKPYHRFNAGKTDKTDHKEFVFLTFIEK